MSSKSKTRKPKKSRTTDSDEENFNEDQKVLKVFMTGKLREICGEAIEFPDLMAPQAIRDRLLSYLPDAGDVTLLPVSEENVIDVSCGGYPIDPSAMDRVGAWRALVGPPSLRLPGPPDSVRRVPSSDATPPPATSTAADWDAAAKLISDHGWECERVPAVKRAPPAARRAISMLKSRFRSRVSDTLNKACYAERRQLLKEIFADAPSPLPDDKWAVVCEEMSSGVLQLDTLAKARGFMETFMRTRFVGLDHDCPEAKDSAVVDDVAGDDHSSEQPSAKRGANRSTRGKTK